MRPPLAYLRLFLCTSTIPMSTMAGISRGERKRLSVATELLSDPQILLADEPTSSLDAVMANQIVSTLRSLADTGRIVLASIHQPSSKTFQLFTHVILLASGRLVYSGRRSEVVDYFDRYLL